MRYSSFQAVLTRPATIKHLLEGNIGLAAPSQRIIDDNKRNFWQEIILGETTLDNSTLETIHFIAYPGESYVYSIHDYTNRGSSISNWMGNSGAKVTVYRGNAELGSFIVPAGSGTVWHVFRVDDNELTPTNAVGFCASPEAVGVGIR